jgi:Cytochrome c7 and related cytochrome c
MNNRLVTIVLVIAVLFLGVALVPKVKALRLPGNNRDFEPAQPIAFSHRLHAGELSVPCLYCHSGAETSRHAGIPPAGTCMNCHRYITAARSAVRAEEQAAKKERRKPNRVISPELQKTYTALAIDTATMRPTPGRPMQPIVWNRIYKIPDFAYFDHRAHVAAGVECQKCHGAVETMERVRQVPDLTMGWCVNCHRGRDGTMLASGPVRAPSDCSTCHY